MPRNLDHRIEVVVPDRGRARAQRDRVDLQGAARRQLARPGSSTPTGRGTRVHAEEERAPSARRRSLFMRRARRAPAPGAGRTRRLPSCGVATMTAMPVGVVDVGSNTVRLLVVRARAHRPLGARDAPARRGRRARRPDLRTEKLARDGRGRRRLRRRRARDGVERARGAGHEPRPPGRERRRAAGRALERAARLPGRACSPRSRRAGSRSSARSALAAPPRAGTSPSSTSAAARRRSSSARGGTARAGRVDRPRLTAADEPPARATTRRATARPSARAPRSSATRPASSRRAPRRRLAVGGSARALKRIVGLAARRRRARATRAMLVATRRPPRSRAALRDRRPERARTLAAGAVILAAIQRRLGPPLRVVRGGLRDGALADARRAPRRGLGDR